MDKIRLDRYLANMGAGTRTEVKKYISQRKVYVDGVPVTDAGFKITAGQNEVKLNGAIIQYQSNVYLMLNKPEGIVSATKDTNEKTVLDILPEKYKAMGVFPVGRLDKDTVGLLLLTNDGDFAHETLAPKKHVQKKYFARVAGQWQDNVVEKFSEGIILKDGYACKSAELSILNKGNESSDVEIIIHEGKYHQIKRMFAAVGMRVVYLKRLSFGDIILDNELNEGDYRELNLKEMEYVKHIMTDRR